MVFGRIMRGLARTRRKLGAGLSRLFAGGRHLDEEILEELEELLYEADLGPTGTEIVASLAAAWQRKEIGDTGQVRPFLRRELLARLDGCRADLARAVQGPTVILVAGVNGSGKTTSIAKLAKRLQDQGHKVMLAAGDTFRAAAVEQLTIWADRIGVPIIKQPTGADPASVAFDAADAALARQVDFLIVDTAGRLHTQKNLMAELEKIGRVLSRKIPGAPHESLLVLDATTGQNAIRQAEEFRERVALTGLVVAKLDGTAKGGAIFGIRRNMDIPVKFIGLGEGLDDLEEFEPESFIDAVLTGDEEPREA